MSPRKAIREGHDAGKIYPFVVVTETDLLLCLSTAIRYPLSPREALDLAASLEDGARLLTRKAGDVAPPISEDEVGQSIDDGRFDVAVALVSAVMGGWHDHAPYADLAREIVEDPYVGVKMALEALDKRRASRVKGKDSVCPTCGGKEQPWAIHWKRDGESGWIGRSDFFRWMGSEVSAKLVATRLGEAADAAYAAEQLTCPACGKTNAKNQP